MKFKAWLKARYFRFRPLYHLQICIACNEFKNDGSNFNDGVKGGTEVVGIGFRRQYHDYSF